jgi:hypothetical protein
VVQNIVTTFFILPLFKKVVQNIFYFFLRNLFEKLLFGSTFPKGGILAPPFPKVD